MTTTWRVRSSQLITATSEAWVTGGRIHTFPLFAIAKDPVVEDDFDLYELYACAEVVQGGNVYRYLFAPRRMGLHRVVFRLDMVGNGIENYKVCVRLRAFSSATLSGDFRVYRLRDKIEPPPPGE